MPFISLYDGKESSSSAKLTPPWEARGRGLYAGKPIFVLGGASTVGQFGAHIPSEQPPCHKLTQLSR